MFLWCLKTFAALVISWASWVCLRWCMSVWRAATSDNLPGPPASSWIFGHLPEIASVDGWDFHRLLIRTYPTITRMKTVLSREALYVFDPKALHQMFVKDQHVWSNIEFALDMNRILFGEGILGAVGERHRVQRKILAPMFSDARIKEMLSKFWQVGHRMEETFLRMTENGPKEIDLVHWNGRLSLELIGQAGLGYSFDKLNEECAPHPCAAAIKQLVCFALKGGPLQHVLVPFFLRLGTPGFRKWIAQRLPGEDMATMRRICEVIEKTSRDTIESKKLALRMDNEKGEDEAQDMISILVRENLKAAADERLSDAELLGQVASLTFAATDTTSGALSRAMQLLAQHSEIQDSLREEIKAAVLASGDGVEVSYETLMSLPLLDGVCRETLRLYPPLPYLARTCTQDTDLTLSRPIKGKDGTWIDRVPVKAGTHAWVSVWGANTHRDLWGDDGEEWKPQRWLQPEDGSESLSKRLAIADSPSAGVYSHLLTFSGGGRSCIGFKFAQIEMKMWLFLLLQRLEVLESETPVHWKMTGVSTPHTKVDSLFPSLPIIVKRVAARSF